MYLLIFVRLQAERRISFVKGSLAFMTGVHSKVATIMKETESGTRCGRRTMYVSCRSIASGSISVMRYNNNNTPWTGLSTSYKFPNIQFSVETSTPTTVYGIQLYTSKLEVMSLWNGLLLTIVI